VLSAGNSRPQRQSGNLLGEADPAPTALTCPPGCTPSPAPAPTTPPPSGSAVPVGRTFACVWPVLVM